MQKPLIHRNGTSSEALLDGYIVAGAALGKALETLQDAAPHARDYYPLGDEAVSLARKEHEARIAALRTVYDQIRELAEHVANWQAADEC